MRRVEGGGTESMIVEAWNTPSPETSKKVLIHILPRVAEIKQMADMSARVGKYKSGDRIEDCNGDK